MTHESTPTMRYRGLGVKGRTFHRDGIYREQFDALLEHRNGTQYAARLTPETGGWACVATIDGKRREGRGVTVDAAFHDATEGELRDARGATGAWTATITDLDGHDHEGHDSRPGQALQRAYSELTRALSARKGGVR